MAFVGAPDEPQCPQLQQAAQLDFLRSRRVALVQACCGSGKTFTLLSAVLQSDANVAVVVVPWLVLTDQIVREYFDKFDKLPQFRAYARRVVSSGGTTDRSDVERFLASRGGRLSCRLTSLQE